MDLVLLHAFPLDSAMWPAGLRAITPDQRGGDREPDLEHVARDVLAEVNARGIDRFVLGGCSMGGYVAMQVLRIAPERVAGLVLVDTKADADTEEARDNRLAMAKRVEEEGVDWVPDALLPALFSDNAPEEAVSKARRIIRRQSPEEVTWAQRAMAKRPDSTKLLERTTVPALVIVGEHDALTPPAKARQMADLLPNSTYREIPGAGHLVPLEAPEAFAEAFVSWQARQTWQRLT
ncbi:alpha/beta hydrolase [Lentzea sp. NBRC 105346]|uniref:alpha/beta fold hydrolase n=1 Tax=Lentzea sp. NBRC 105346 TaxID=3032205 RepID=UPI0024A50636|nr:alpha/beta fold hydrolase [Lentzea sp. NBRC 105346]GLZ30240.1 alpha/beta hydrolase [Lentzea sp. NBRC 105346]